MRTSTGGCEWSKKTSRGCGVRFERLLAESFLSAEIR